MIDLTIRNNLEMFRRAWAEQVVPKYNTGPNTTVEESQRLWLEEFKCEMTYGKSGFVTAKFNNDEDYTWFMLRWT